jgi:citrate lyase subunit gamma (acyl carrier protein)
MKTTSAGTIESMDCLVTVTEGASGSGIAVTITGSSAARFGTAMKKTVLATVKDLQYTGDVSIAVQDNGALDLVLSARTKAAILRFLGGAA